MQGETSALDLDISTTQARRPPSLVGHLVGVVGGREALGAGDGAVGDGVG
jgi:hypothetical protein